MPPHGGDSTTVTGNGTMANSRMRLRLNPNKDHKPEGYDDLELDFSPSIFSSLEKHLPPNMLVFSRDDKAKFMREILLKYLPNGERHRVWFFQFLQSFFCKVCIFFFVFYEALTHTEYDTDTSTPMARFKKITQLNVITCLGVDTGEFDQHNIGYIWINSLLYCTTTYHDKSLCISLHKLLL